MAQDALHDAYLKVWKNADAFDPSRSSPVTWLALIARSRSIDSIRRRRDGETIALSDAMIAVDPSRSAEAVAISSHEGSRLRSALMRLEQRQRDLIQSAYFEGLTYREVAIRTCRPVGTVKSDIRRGE